MKIHARHDQVLSHINQALLFIQRQQKSDGSFSHLIFPQESTRTSPFITALIASALVKCKQEVASDVGQRAVHFLLTQKSSYWTFNYWAKGSAQQQKMPYPDDLDDTCCCLLAIHQYKPEKIDGKVLAKLTEILTLVEQKEGGPYKTWLVKQSAPKYFQDVDLVVNANISRLLGQFELALPNLTAFFKENIEYKKYSSPYYHQSYPVFYFFAQALSVPTTTKSELLIQSQSQLASLRVVLAKHILAHIQKNPMQSLLEMSIAVSCLIRLGVGNDQVNPILLRLLSKSPQTWQADPFIIEPLDEKEKGIAGCAALTAAIYCEALTLWLKTQQKSSIPHKQTLKVHQAIVTERDQFQHRLPIELQHFSKPFFAHTDREDSTHQMTLFPMYFGQMIKKQKKQIDPMLFVQLGLCSVYGWAAYTIYDDVLDGDGGIKELGMANACLRELTTVFTQLSVSYPGMLQFCQQTMNEIDAANTWEVMNARFDVKKKYELPFALPDFGNYLTLAQRSFGHALGPLCVFFVAGHSMKSKEFQALTKFFQNYLVAKQLNDDAHDWKIDLSNGRHTPITVMLIKNFQKKYPNKVIKHLEIVEELNKSFWKSDILRVVQLIEVVLKEARETFLVLEKGIDVQQLSNFLLPIEQSLKQVRTQHKQTTEFLSSYHPQKSSHFSTFFN